MIDRREFIGTLGALAAGAVLPACRAPRRLDRIGVQLYTVRGEMERDFEGTLARTSAGVWPKYPANSTSL